MARGRRQTEARAALRLTLDSGAVVALSRRDDRALVVASALERGSGVILTGDPEDLDSLAASHPEVTIQAL